MLPYVLPCSNILKISIKIANQITHCSNSWDQLLPDNHHLKSTHLLAFEQSNIEDIEKYYVQVFVKTKLIGQVYLQRFLLQHKHLNFRLDQGFLSRLIDIFMPAQLPVLICGHLFRINFQGFYFTNPAHQVLVFDAIQLFIRQNKNCKHAGIMIKDCSEVFIAQKCSLFGYWFFNGDVTMEIARRPYWLSFNDYLKDLNKKYLQRAQKIIQAFEGIEVRELTAGEILNQSFTINQLYWNVVNKQTVKLGTVNTQYFYELKKDLHQKFELHALYKNQQMVGFYTFIFYENDMETHYIGLDYEANKLHKIYFNILFLGIAKMISGQYIKLELGRTAREAKTSAGALPKQIFNYVKIKNILVKITLNYFLKRFNKSEDQHQINRSPLK